MVKLTKEQREAIDEYNEGQRELDLVKSRALLVGGETNIPVIWTQLGTWGGKTFSGRLQWELVLPGMPEMGSQPVLVVADGHEGWSGLVVRCGRAPFPGRFARGYEHPLSGQYYRGSVEIGDSGASIGQPLPSEVGSAPVSYLHIEDAVAAVPITAEQKALLIAAVQYRPEGAPFTAGATLQRWAQLTDAEREGELLGKVAYASRG